MGREGFGPVCGCKIEPRMGADEADETDIRSMDFSPCIWLNLDLGDLTDYQERILPLKTGQEL